MSLASGTVTASLTSGAGAGAGPGSDNTYGHAATTATASAFGFPDWRTMAEERDADEEDEATADRQLVNDRCCDLFLVDASESMRAVPAGLGRSPLQASLAAITVFMQAKIKQSDSDTISLVLFGTQSTTRNELGCAGIHKLVDMDLPSIANIKRLEELSGDPAKLADAVGGPGECQFHQVFWLATNIFSRSAPRMARKRIFLITNNDDPTKGSQTALDSANTRIKDLENNHISIELFALNKTPTERFDFSLFYGKITEFWRDEDVEKSAMPLDGDYKALAERVQQKEFKKRVAFRVPFQISQTLQIGVKAFYLIMEKKAPDSTKVDIDGREVVTQSGLICSTTRELLGPKDLKYFYELGDARAIFTKDELDQIKTIGSPGLLLLGFKDIGDLKLKHNVRPSVFVVPDESLFEGSTSFFAHLHKRMCERKKMAICRLIARKTANPRMVALLPQAKGVDPTGREIPAGFNAIFLPFGDDLRKLSFVGDPVDAQNLDAATALIRAAAMNHFDFTVCHNPALQMLGKLIEAEAYGRDDVDFVDSTLPDEDAIRSRHGALIAAFNNICIGPNASGGAGGLARAGRRAAPVRPLPDSAGTDDADEDASQPMPRKRAARPSDSQESSGAGPSGAGPSGASRTGTTSKRSRGPVDLSVEGVRELSAKGNLGQLTIAQLTEFLQTVNWPIRGKRKPELIACVEQYLARHP
nr:X-ray repair cross-complementing protein 6 [Polyrhizophydium stewartii]